ncbi:MAG: GFA family protein [Pseudomonadota bacterium]
MTREHRMSTTGSCLCGAVAYRVDGPLRDVLACHCTQCRKTSGNFVTATSCAKSDLSIAGEASISWFTSSPGVRRGFCSVCGSQLFWDVAARSTMSIFAGTLDGDPGLRLSGHIFCEAKGGYYEITDGLPQQTGAYRRESCG